MLKDQLSRTSGFQFTNGFSGLLRNGPLGSVSRKARELFGPEKPVVKLQSVYFEKLILQHVFNVRKTERIAKFGGLEPRRCEDIKGLVAPEIGPKSFGTFEKQATGLQNFLHESILK